MFQPFTKIPRFARDCVVTEKLDGTNAQIYITTDQAAWSYARDGAVAKVDDTYIFAGSRNRWLKPGKQDNYGFAGWVVANLDELLKLGEGRHFGEWWGNGIQRGYDMKEKKFSMFNCNRWTAETLPSCVGVVPILWQGNFEDLMVDMLMQEFQLRGSAAAPGYMNPEGVIIYHSGAGYLFKKTFESDEKGKGI